MVNYAPDVEFAAKILGPLDAFLAQPREYQETILDQAVGQLPQELQGAALEILAKGIEAHIQQAANNIVRFSRDQQAAAVALNPSGRYL
jgi:hypothetical protein